MHQEESKEILVNREIVYVLGKFIGSGAQGDAYQLIRKDTGEVFICKVNKSQDDLESAREEAQRLKQYHHKNIVRYVDNFIQNLGFRTHYLIMENCSGGELRGFIKENSAKKENTEVYIKYFSDIVEGLAEIHGRGEMHRDMKPENVFILITGKSAIEHVMKLGDFGLFRKVDKTLMTAASKGVGTPAYMSPEQHKLESYGPSSDVWAAGVILYEMFAGYHPFQTVKDIKKNPPAQLPEYVPKDVKELLANLLEKDPTKRMKISEIQSWLFLRKQTAKVPQAGNVDKDETAGLKA